MIGNAKMTLQKHLLSILLLSAASVNIQAQESDYSNEKPSESSNGEYEYRIEAQGSFSSGKTPLWLNANKYGLSSLEKNNGYLRGAVSRPINNDSEKKWSYGYGIDLAVPFNYTSKFIVQQAYAEGRWLHGTLSVGSKQREMNLKNNTLSSGSQTLGINARPVPQVRLSLEDYWQVPLTNGWLQLKGHIAYGMLTDNSWQHDFTQKNSRYAENTLYHSKAGFLRIGKDPYMYPFSIELGLEMASLFGGTAYLPTSDGQMQEIKGETGVKGFWNAFIPGGKDATDGDNYKNVEGDQLGSWMIRLNYETELWKAGIYADKFFEDHSAMFQIDYDGYGTGDEWQQKKKRRYMVYDFKDWMLGFDLNIKYGSWLHNIVVEYLYTKYQSGPIYHDHTQTIPDHIGGNDNFYNHNIYAGWQHWGQVMGNPLYRSPIYNTDGTISVQDNRFMAFHLGFDGEPTENVKYRVLATYQEGLGTYTNPYTKQHHNISFLVEGQYRFNIKPIRNWSIKAAYAMDFGGILGNNHGFQFTIAKTGCFNL